MPQGTLLSSVLLCSVISLLFWPLLFGGVKLTVPLSLSWKKIPNEMCFPFSPVNESRLLVDGLPDAFFVLSGTSTALEISLAASNPWRYRYNFSKVTPGPPRAALFPVCSFGTKVRFPRMAPTQQGKVLRGSYVCTWLFRVSLYHQMLLF